MKKKWCVEFDRSGYRIIVWREEYRWYWWARLVIFFFQLNWPDSECGIFRTDSNYAKTPCLGRFDYVPKGDTE